MNVLLAIVLGLVSPRTHDLAAGALSTAPAYLTTASALEHATAASIAGLAYDVDPALLLSIAHHESRYQAAAITAEVGGKVSCGVMTPEPIATCARASLLGGYLAGARHLRTWLDAEHGDVHAAITGYAGGYYLIKFCAAGGEHRGCHVPSVFLERAEWIRRKATS